MRLNADKTQTTTKVKASYSNDDFVSLYYQAVNEGDEDQISDLVKFNLSSTGDSQDIMESLFLHMNDNKREYSILGYDQNTQNMNVFSFKNEADYKKAFDKLKEITDEY